MKHKQMDPELFQLAQSESIKIQTDISQKNSKPALNYWTDSWRRFKQNKSALFGLFMIIIIVILAIVGPLTNEYGVAEQDMSRSNLPPKIPILEKIPLLNLDGVDIRGNDQYAVKNIQEYFWFGTDDLGRDLWTRVWSGARISLYIAFLAAAIDLLIGIVYGGVSAYFGGRIDNVMQRFIEVLMGIPNLIFIILLIMLLQPGILTITLAIIITGWVNMARVVRGQILKLKGMDFILASKTLGANHSRLLWRHLIPNTTGAIIITTMFTIPSAIFIEAFLSFIGLGLQPPLASLGTLVNDGFKLLRIYPHLMVISSVVISVIMISFNLIGDGLRDALDPKMRS